VSEENRRVAGRYQLSERLGAGAMGMVWRAEDEMLNRVVAVKELLLPPSLDERLADQARRRAMREARIAARLQHPNAITVYDVVEHDGQPWLIMEYLPSKSLAATIAEHGPLPVDDVVRIGNQLADALAAAHKVSVVHRDVKPGNVLLGDNGAVKITDFGISRAVDDANATATGRSVGTPAFFSPEVAKGEDGGYPSDVFSLGATLYNAVEGTPPFGISENSIAQLHRVAGGEIRQPTQAGPLTPVLLRLLDPDPATRPTMAEAAEELAVLAEIGDPTVAGPAPTLVQETPTQAITPPPPPVSPPSTEDQAKRRKAILGLVAAVLLLVAIVGAAFLIANRDKSSNATTQNTGAQTTTTTPAATATSGAVQPPVATSTAASTPSSSSPPPTSSSPPPATDGGGQAGMTKAISDYFGLLPGNQEAAYARLTDGFKQRMVPTFADYQAFWNRFSSVTASNVTAQGPNTVSANLQYVEKAGGTISESHVYTMVLQNGQWLIDAQN
jgi:serine/threonine protein kinase